VSSSWGYDRPTLTQSPHPPQPSGSESFDCNAARQSAGSIVMMRQLTRLLASCLDLARLAVLDRLYSQDPSLNIKTMDTPLSNAPFLLVSTTTRIPSLP
jgi:hypothetical protein